jgi:hypothetical protein
VSHLPASPYNPSRRPGAAARADALLYCEIAGLPVEIDPLELSAAGLFVETASPVAVDSEVEVFVRIGELRISANGTVVKSVSCKVASAQGKKPGYALLFTNLDDAARKRLTSAVESLRAQQKPAAANSNAERPTAARAAAEREGVTRPPPAAQRDSAPAQRASVAHAAPTPKRDSVPAAQRANVANAASTARRDAAMQRPAASHQPPAAKRDSAPAMPRQRQSATSVPRGSLQPKPAPAPPKKEPSYDPGELTLLAQLQTQLQELGAKTAWAVLGVSQGATDAQLKAAFFAASKRFHPHLFARYAHPEITRLVTELFIAHKRAYTTLLKAGKTTKSGRA